MASALSRDLFDRMLREDDPLLRARWTRKYIVELQRDARRRVAAIRKRSVALDKERGREHG